MRGLNADKSSPLIPGTLVPPGGAPPVVVPPAPEFCRDMNNIENVHGCWNEEKLKDYNEIKNADGTVKWYNFKCCGKQNPIKPSEWICNATYGIDGYNGIYTSIRSIRKNAKSEVECYSLNKNRACTIHKNMGDCKTFTDELNKNPNTDKTFSCGTDFGKEYKQPNNSGYGGLGYCSQGYLRLMALNK